MDLTFILIAAFSLVMWAVVFDVHAKRKKALQAAPELLDGPGTPALASDKWIQESPWPELAKAHGWTCVEERPLEAAAAFRITGSAKGQDFEAIASLHFGVVSFLPERLRIRTQSRRPPGNLLFRGSALFWDRTTAQLSPGQPWLPELADKQSLSWQEAWLELTLESPKDPGACVVQTMALFEELRQAEFPAWYAPKEGWTLKMDRTGQWPRLSRSVESRTVSANLERVQGHVRTRIMAPLPPQETRFSLIHPDFQSEAKVPTRHPIADTLLNATGDGEALHALLSDPEAFAPIMAVVHGYPGSRLTQDQIELIAAGDLGESLPEAIDTVLQAANAIWKGA